MAEAGDRPKSAELAVALDEGTRRALERQAQKADCSAEDLAAALIALMLHQFALVAPDARRAARRARP